MSGLLSALAPVRGTAWIADHLLQEARRQTCDPRAVQARLAAPQQNPGRGAIDGRPSNGRASACSPSSNNRTGLAAPPNRGSSAEGHVLRTARRPWRQPWRTGYLLGRTKKSETRLRGGLRTSWAGASALSPGQVLSQGLAGLQRRAPQLQELTDQVRGELLTAGRTPSPPRRAESPAYRGHPKSRTDALTGAGRRDDGGYEGATGTTGPDGDAYFDEEGWKEARRRPAPAPPGRRPRRLPAQGGTSPKGCEEDREDREEDSQEDRCRFEEDHGLGPARGERG
ncbi:gas vesicle protein GvpG [Streptomyces thinghirensis]|nr:gas vesicle protein GvpG [Streptomyces thinghirensis]